MSTKRYVGYNMPKGTTFKEGGHVNIITSNGLEKDKGFWIEYCDIVDEYNRLKVNSAKEIERIQDFYEGVVSRLEAKLRREKSKNYKLELIRNKNKLAKSESCIQNIINTMRDFDYIEDDERGVDV